MNDARNIFFVPGDSDARGEVVTVEEPACPNEEEAAGAVGPITDGKDALESWCLGGKCVTPGGASGARFDASDSPSGAGG